MKTKNNYVAELTPALEAQLYHVLEAFSAAVERHWEPKKTKDYSKLLPSHAPQKPPAPMRERVKEFLRQNPDAGTKRTAIDLRTSECTVRQAKKELREEGNGK